MYSFHPLPLSGAIKSRSRPYLNYTLLLVSEFLAHNLSSILYMHNITSVMQGLLWGEPELEKVLSSLEYIAVQQMSLKQHRSMKLKPGRQTVTQT